MKESLSKALHELTSISQMFHSYEMLLENEGFHLAPKKLKEICHRGALKTREIRQITLEVLDDTGKHTHSVTLIGNNWSHGRVGELPTTNESGGDTNTGVTTTFSTQP
jgi:hypothetical protein